MIPLHPRRHRADVDPDGTIILPEDDDVVTAPETEDVPGLRLLRAEWTIEDEPLPAEMKRPPKPVHSIFAQVRWTIRQISGELLEECTDQYRFSFHTLGNSLRSAGTALASAGCTLWAFLTQPVWIVSPSQKPKQYTRVTLFLLDTVRFGGTFAAIFVALFVTLNYESFWNIVSERINPIEHARSVQALSESVDSKLKDHLANAPSLSVAGGNMGDLLSFLPPVGPPENRLIVPKLNLNVPIATPPYDALLKEDWAQVEKDIQMALQDGVVHYPGTAKPGQAGNFFVTGHSSYYPWAPGKYKTVFARLSELAPGDDYWVYFGGDKHRYVIRTKEEVSPTNVSVLDQPSNKKLGTLMTCTPIGTALHRLILTAEEVDPSTGIALKPGESGSHVLPASRPEALPI